MKNNCLIFTTLLSVIVLIPQSAMAITKCKDADGKWHYGDVAVSQCEDSKVTKLNERGFVTDEIPAAKSLEEQQAEAARLAEKQAEEDRLIHENNEKLRVLSIYESEDDIDRLRDNQLSSIQSNIAVHEAYLKSMKNRVEDYKVKQETLTSNVVKQTYQDKIDEAESRIDSSAQELENLNKQKEQVVEKFLQEKALYHELKSNSTVKKLLERIVVC